MEPLISRSRKRSANELAMKITVTCSLALLFNLLICTLPHFEFHNGTLTSGAADRRYRRVRLLCPPAPLSDMAKAGQRRQKADPPSGLAAAAEELSCESYWIGVLCGRLFTRMFNPLFFNPSFAPLHQNKNLFNVTLETPIWKHLDECWDATDWLLTKLVHCFDKMHFFS